ncbi:MAG: A/G-specific adenine glycosylase [Deltaproteobacteria bacterium]|nr:A/G-specific adenine glycosylase [Deltaproteobacteria bacterium]
MTPAKRKTIQDQLLSWYAHHHRDLPWRRTRNPYHIWISEVMLQQTRVDTVVPFYERFVSTFPTFEALAGASLRSVLKVWENLGYYSRARNLHKAAHVIVHEMNGEFPSSMKDLRNLPGIGPYIAAAISSIAFGQVVPAVDGNVKRVLARVFFIQDPSDDKDVKQQIQDIANVLVPKHDSGAFNQAVMELGAMICRPRNPRCRECPINKSCEAFDHGAQDSLPVLLKRHPIPHKEMTAGIMFNQKRQLLVVQRPNHGLLGGLWKFPGGERMEGDKDLAHTLRRSIREETGIHVRVGKTLHSVKHTYTHFRITLFAFQCSRRSGVPIPLDCQDVLWVKVGDLGQLPMSKADRKIWELL